MKKVIEFLRNNIKEKDSLVVACSGGPDSMCLLDLVTKLKDELNLIDPKVKEKLFVEFDEGANWMTRPDLLRLFTDTMPLWDSSDLSFFIGRLLAKVQKEHNIPELLQERYLRVFENYLAVYYKKNNPAKNRGVQWTRA